MVAGESQFNLIQAPAVSPSVTQSRESATPSATPCASSMSDSSTDETLTVAKGAIFRMPDLSVRPASADRTGRLMTAAVRCPWNAAWYHLRADARSSIARKPAIKHTATSVNVTKLRADFVIESSLCSQVRPVFVHCPPVHVPNDPLDAEDRKSTRLNSSHLGISY